MERKNLKIALGVFLVSLFVGCNDSGVDSDDLKINPGEQPILKSQPEETIKVTPEVPSEPVQGE